MGQRSPYYLLLPVKTPKPHQQTAKPTSTSASKDPMKYKHAEPRAKTPSKVPLPSTTGAGLDETRGTAPSESTDGNKDVPMEASTEHSIPPTEETVLPQAPQKDGTPSKKVASIQRSQSWTTVRSGTKRNRSIEHSKSLSVYKDSSYVSLPHTGDHLAHIATFANPSQLQGRGYWKCPLSLFDYLVIKEAIGEEADRILGQLRASTHPGTVWEKWKKHVKHLLQRIHQKIRHQEETDVIRAQAVLEEAATTFRKSNQEHDKQIYEISTNPIDITLQFTDHWGGIMGDQSSTAGLPLHPCAQKQAILISSVTKILSSSDESFLSSPLTKKEMEEAIKHMRGYSSPGMDGLPAAFYQLAPSVFGECLQIVFDDQLRRGTLLRSQRSSAITLLYKKGSRADPGNYRPIALMCVDVKVLSKVLAYRLHQVLPKLIHEDQKAFL
uniref:Pollike protein putative n=1 Tax=Albugo laibachii Nc14 TaxID=890382 RepID=F0WF47_9STRA|nr:pollike protein putative [Albugo laibachii Nc14]|eukprot:CCA19829.1 pollike protein putative [Albugo laibachii Nc14]